MVYASKLLKLAPDSTYPLPRFSALSQDDENHSAAAFGATSQVRWKGTLPDHTCSRLRRAQAITGRDYLNYTATPRRFERDLQVSCNRSSASQCDKPFCLPTSGRPREEDGRGSGGRSERKGSRSQTRPIRTFGALEQIVSNSIPTRFVPFCPFSSPAEQTEDLSNVRYPCRHRTPVVRDQPRSDFRSVPQDCLEQAASRSRGHCVRRRIRVCHPPGFLGRSFFDG